MSVIIEKQEIIAELTTYVTEYIMAAIELPWELIIWIVEIFKTVFP